MLYLKFLIKAPKVVEQILAGQGLWVDVKNIKKMTENL